MSFDLAKLGVKQNIPRVNFTEYSGIISAPPKWGKTTLASLYPDAVLLAFEKGYKAQFINVKDINEWEDFVEFIDLLEEHREEIGDSIQTIVIDTVNEAYDMVEPYMVRKESVKDGTRYTKKAAIPYGQGWNLHDTYFREQIQRIYSLGFAITYITHMEIKTIKPKDGEEYNVYKTTMPDRLANIVFPECDYILYGDRVTITDDNGDKINKRRLTTRGTESVESGNRVYLDEDIIFDTEEEAMDRFQELFKKSIQNKLDRADIDKSIDELSKEQAEETKSDVVEALNNNDETTVKQEILQEFTEKFKSADAKTKTDVVNLFKKHKITLADLKDVDKTDIAIYNELQEIIN